MKFETVKFSDITVNLDKKRIPLSTMERSKRQGSYRYYGAQGVIDYIDDYIFDGKYLLIAEDGENLKSKKQNIAQLAEGKFWVNNHAHILQCNDRCRLEYLCFLLNSMDLSGYITGSAQPKLSQASMNNIEFKIPSVEIQDYILSIVLPIENKIAVNTAINENLEQQAQALFKDMIADVKEQVPFTSVIQVLGGGTPKTGNHEYWNGEIPFFTPKDVGNPYVMTTEKNITPLGLDNCNSRLYPVNTVFLTARGTVGKVSLAGVPMAMNQSCYALTGKDGFNQIIVYHYVLETVKALKHKASGAVFDAIITRDFDTENIPALSSKQIRDFITVTEPIYSEILNRTLENQRLSALRDTLLPKLMNGEIDVSQVRI